MSSRCRDKICPPAKICNPSSGRCVLRTGKIGQSLQSDMETSSGKLSPPGRRPVCPNGKIVNPKSGRCVNIDGKIGQLLALAGGDKITAPPGKEESSLSHSFGVEFDQFITPGYKLEKILGEGSYGTAYLACKNKYDCKVYKAQLIKGNHTKEFLHEVYMQQKFAKINLAPKLTNSILFQKKKKNYGFIEMEAVDGTLQDLLKTKRNDEFLDRVIVWCGDIIEVMCNEDIIHGDLHWGNIGFKLVLNPNGDVINIQFMLIDFGWACCKKKIACNIELELSQLLRTVRLGVSRKMHKYNRSYIEKALLAIYRETIDPNLSDNWDDWYDEYNKAFQQAKKVYYNPENWE